jgi:hypothetical protein
MSQPTTYDRQYSFSAFQTVNPDDPLPAATNFIYATLVKGVA